MADVCTTNLLEAMDCLWFHQIAVSSVDNLRDTHKTIQPALPTSEMLTYSSSNISELSLPEGEISFTASCISSSSEDDCSNQLEIVENKDVKQNLQQPTRLNTIAIESQPDPSPSNRSHKKQKLKSYEGSVTRLQKTMSCKTWEELELEEVKGFIDLGFEFKRENISPKMMSLVPGLQRFGSWDEEGNGSIQNCDHELIEEGEEEDTGVMRPYLSEAWIENTPKSGYANIGLPGMSRAGDMKKHIRCWARNVASLIRQESCRSV